MAPAPSSDSLERLGAIAHDLNNVLTQIMMNCDLLLEALPPDHLAREDAMTSRAAAMRGAELTYELHSLVRELKARGERL